MRTGRVSLTVKLTPGKDDDLINWWQSISVGKGQAIVKSILREYLERGQTETPSSKLDQIGRDTTWLRAALAELPAHLETLIAHADMRPIQQNHAADVEQLSEGDAVRRGETYR